MLKPLSALLAFLVLLPAFASDWPRFRNEKADGISGETGINKDWKAKAPKELWRIELHDKGYSGPAIAGGKLFIIDRDGDNDNVCAFNAADGKPVWNYKYAAKFDPGSPDWGWGRSTPCVDGDRVYTLSPVGILHCFESATGKVVWKRNIQDEFQGKRRKETWHYAECPTIDGDKLVVCPGGPGAAVVTLDKKSGKDIWKGGGDDQAGYGSIVIATIEGKKQYVALAGYALIGVDAENGALLWRFPWETSYDVNASTPVVSGNQVFITTGYGRGCALVEISGGKANKVWENKEMKSHFNTPILLNGYLYGSSDPGIFACIEWKSGKLMWKQRGFEKGGTILVDGVLIAVDGATGDVALINPDPAAYKELGRIHPLPGRHWSPPVFSDGKLYVRNRPNLVCLDLK